MTPTQPLHSPGPWHIDPVEHWGAWIVGADHWPIAYVKNEADAWLIVEVVNAVMEEQAAE